MGDGTLVLFRRPRPALVEAVSFQDCLAPSNEPGLWVHPSAGFSCPEGAIEFRTAQVASPGPYFRKLRCVPRRRLISEYQRTLANITFRCI